jgi:putative transposase
MKTRRYETDLRDQQFAAWEPFLPKPKRRGRPPADLREVSNGIPYLGRTGRQWRLLPKDFPPGSTGHTYYRRWRKDGTREQPHEPLRQQVRRRARRAPRPRASAADSQSAKTAGQGGEGGFDNGKKVQGRKRHSWMGSLGLLLAVPGTAADVPAPRAACTLLHLRWWDELPRREVVCSDSPYTAAYLGEEVLAWSRLRREVVSRPAGPAGPEGGVKLPQRWVAGRTIAWLGRSRRLREDGEREPKSSEAMTRVSMIHLRPRRLAPSTPPHTQRFRYAA